MIIIIIISLDYGVEAAAERLYRMFFFCFLIF